MVGTSFFTVNNTETLDTISFFSWIVIVGIFLAIGIFVYLLIRDVKQNNAPRYFKGQFVTVIKSRNRVMIEKVDFNKRVVETDYGKFRFKDIQP